MVDYDVPVMYQDLGAYSMNCMMPMSGMVPNTNYLGGVKMQPILCKDKVELINKKDKEGLSTAKKLGLAIGVLFLAGYIPYFRKQISKAGGIKACLSNGWNKFKNLFKKTP